MRKAPSALLLSVLVPLAGAVPVLSAPTPQPRPVVSEVRSQPLRGVDRAVTPAALRRSADTAKQFRAQAAAADRGTRPTGRPEVLSSRTGLATFNLLGVTWRRTTPEPKLTILVRTRSTDGWTGWTALEPADAPGPREARPARLGTEPYWVGESDGYQVRVDVRSGRLPGGLRVDLVDPGSSPADTRPQGTRPLQSAQAAAGMPQIFTRAQWGADESLRREAPSYNATIKAGFVHHTAGSNNYSRADVPKILRAIYAYHVRGNGWSDIGYNFLVDRFGRTWEGRYGGMDRAVVGAHTGGFNVDSFAVSAIGNYDKVTAPPVVLDSIARVLAWKLSANFRDPNGTTTLVSQGGSTSRFGPGTRVKVPVIAGHRDVGNTSCPGRNIYAEMDTIRSLVTSYLGTTMFDPRVSTRTAVYGTGASVTATARPNTDQQWRLEVREVCRGALVRTLTGTSSPSAPVAAVWDLRDESGLEVRPGAYTLTLVGTDATASTYPWVTTVAVNPPRTAPPPVAAAPAPGRTGFVPVDPTKVFDTRSAGALPLGPGQQVDIDVLGAGKVPASGVGAVALNVSASCSTATTEVAVWPTGARKPAAAALNVTPGAPASALTVTPLGGNGKVRLANRSGTTELEVHVVGYYPLAGGGVFRPSRPLRLYDSTRDGPGPLGPGGERTITVPTLSGIPATAMTGVLVNVTASKASGTGAITVQSKGAERDSATVAFAPGRPVKSRAVARVENGAFTITGRTASAHVVVDLVGWWAPPEVVRGRLYQPKAATRVLDTRYGVGAPRARVSGGRTITVKVAGRGKPVPAGAKAVVMTLTARDATRSTYVTAWPTGARRPAFPDLSVPAWRPTSNLVVIRVGKKNSVKITNGRGSTHLVGDVVGYYP